MPKCEFVTGRLTRMLTRPKHGTFGGLILDVTPFCATLEPYWRFNKKGVSCLAAGQYVGVPYNSPRFGPVYLLVDTADRAMVEFHAGNWAKDTRGCIILGQHWAKLEGKYATKNSGRTITRFLDYMKGRQLFLTITDCY